MAEEERQDPDAREGERLAKGTTQINKEDQTGQCLTV